MATENPQAVRLLTRREVLGLLGAGVSLAGAAGIALAARPARTLACVARPRQLEGPYFIDEKLNRSDIRTDPGTKVARPGEPLYLTFRVAQMNGVSCTPLLGAQVDVWHCDAEGLYSNTRDYQDDTTGFRFLRGYQLTDKQGLARFTTIYPGWYPGRTVHIHFKIRIGAQGRGGDGKAFTSQIYFDDSVTDAVHAQPPYSKRGPRKVRNNRDVISLIGGSRLVLPLREERRGYAGTFDIALEV
jgi:protocatechuate 3,4-dioxygenase beta subunit